MQVRSFGRRLAATFVLAAAAARADVTVDDPWVRGVVAGQSSTGAFMTIRSTEATELIRVSSPMAASASLHKMVMADSMMSMAPMPSLAIPAHGSVDLKPGTYHLMLIGLKGPLVAGESIPLILTFRGADRVERSMSVQARVGELAGTGASR
jgi:copper(I)-binding protein